MKTSIKLVIFDCDGVLIDSELISKRVLLGKLAALGVDVSDEYFAKYFLGQSFSSVIAQVYADFRVELTDDFRQDYLASLLDVFAEELLPTPGLTKMLERMHIPICVATSSSPARVKSALKTTRLSHFFGKDVFTSSEVKHGKPAPDIFLYAASKMGVAPRHCLVIEDSQAGIEGALAAKMQVIKYAGAGHLRDKGILPLDIANNVQTIFDWTELLERYPSLRSSA